MPANPSANAITKLRRMTAATVAPTVTDADLTSILVDYALTDVAGVLPGDTGWVEGYDWYGAAAEGWAMKEGLASQLVNLNADGSQLSLGQIAEHCRAKKDEYRSLASVGNISVYAP